MVLFIFKRFQFLNNWAHLESEFWYWIIVSHMQSFKMIKILAKNKFWHLFKKNEIVKHLLGLVGIVKLLSLQI